MSDSVLILGAGLPDGVGGALAHRFAREGLHVLVTGRTLEKIEQISMPSSRSWPVAVHLLRR